MRKPRYKTVYDYMEKTGTSQARLLSLVHQKTGRVISQQLFSMILRGSRRCSKWNAFAIHLVTGVSMDELTRWPRYPVPTNSKAVAETSHA